jgi:hypothetical protein
MNIASSNNPQRIYSIDKLTSQNYPIWSIQLEMLLIQNELWGVVNGTKSNPSSAVVAYTTWKIKDSKARSDIILHCGNKVASM